MSAARRRRPPWWLLIAGLALGAAGTLFLLRQPSQGLTGEGLTRARRSWEEKRPASYDLEIETRGALGARHRIEVRGGQVRNMTTGGVEAARSAWEYWSVDGLFDFLETELSNAERPAVAYGAEAGEVVLRVRFDDEWGYPEFFLRHLMGSRQSVEWRVDRFEALAD